MANLKEHWPIGKMCVHRISVHFSLVFVLRLTSYFGINKTGCKTYLLVSVTRKLL
jgi:hypothetical protein